MGIGSCGDGYVESVEKVVDMIVACSDRWRRRWMILRDMVIAVTNAC